jgi:hypothetical protein
MQQAQPLFERDVKKAADRFPKLRLSQTNSTSWVVTGELDICDTVGVYWGTFGIEILVPKTYPFCIPIVREVSTLIPRDIDWHISTSGECCLDIPHKRIYKSRVGINFTDFMTNTVYPYFSNQLYKLQTGVYAGSEFSHNCDGIIQFYRENLGLTAELARLVLNRLTTQVPFTRNELCFCGQDKKLKNCHISIIEFLKSMGRRQLTTDLRCFSAH